MSLLNETISKGDIICLVLDHCQLWDREQPSKVRQCVVARMMLSSVCFEEC